MHLHSDWKSCAPKILALDQNWLPLLPWYLLALRYGANGVKWSEDPSTVDPQQVLKNFTRSSTRDRCRVVTVKVFTLEPMSVTQRVSHSNNIRSSFIARRLFKATYHWTIHWS